MIRRIRVRHYGKHPPGTLVISADKKGRILYELQRRPTTRRKDFDDGRHRNKER